MVFSFVWLLEIPASPLCAIQASASRAMELDFRGRVLQVASRLAIRRITRSAKSDSFTLHGEDTLSEAGNPFHSPEIVHGAGRPVSWTLHRVHVILRGLITRVSTRGKMVFRSAW
jgi:hypothetical protein